LEVFLYHSFLNALFSFAFSFVYLRVLCGEGFAFVFQP
jgi:hypothetical protein